MSLTEKMQAAGTVEEMADAFSPPAVSGQAAHAHEVLDVVEAALLFGAGRISADEFRAVADDSALIEDALIDYL